MGQAETVTELHREMALDHAARIVADLAGLFPALALVEVLGLVAERIERD